MRRLVALSLLLATGCAAATAIYTPIPQRGQSAELTQSDAIACEKVAYDVKEKPHIASGGFLGWWIDESSYKKAYRECMTSRGYALKEQ